MKSTSIAFLILSVGGMTAVAQNGTVNGSAAASGNSAVQAGSSGSSSGSGTASASSSTQTVAQTSAATDRYMTSVQTELTGKVDSKSAMVGQEVTAKTSQTIRLADGTALAKGTKLVGHVTEVQAHSKEEAGAILGLSFDRAELKGGQCVALRGVMQAVAPPVNMAANDGMGLDQAGPAGAMGGAGAMAAPAPAGARGGLGSGGLGGGGLAAPVRSVGSTAGGTLGGVAADTRMAGETTRMAGETAGNVAGQAVATAGETVSAAPRTTGLPGVLLSSSGSATSSGRLTASGKNISLDSGTRITLGVITR
jgi:hypothetical protein